MCTDRHAAGVHLKQLGARHIPGFTEQAAGSVERGWQTMPVQRAEGMGMVISPGVIEGQDHAASVQFPGRKYRAYLFEVGDRKALPVLGQQVHLAGKELRGDRQPTTFNIDPVPAEYSRSGPDGQRPAGPYPNREGNRRLHRSALGTSIPLHGTRRRCRCRDSEASLVMSRLLYPYGGNGADVMIGTRGLSGLTIGERRRAQLLAGAVLLAIASAAGVAIGNWALLVLAGLAAVAILTLILCRLDLAVGLLAADFFFNAYLNHGAGIITIDKAIGGLAVMAWGLEWAVNRRSTLGTRQMWLIAAFLLWTAVSIAVARNEKAALVTSLRYVTFATLYFLVVQTVRGDRRRADVLVKVVIVAAAVASIIGLIAFFSHHVTRASGPIKDPNDFGFILASSVPLAIYQVRWGASRWGKAAWGVTAVLILACTLATFSRSALIGLALASLWAMVTGRLRLRWLLALLACLAAVAGLALRADPRLVHAAFGEKAHVATQNVNVRVGFYRVEVNEWEHNPITGVGPGNFVYRYDQFAPSAQESLPFPSNVLTISGEEAYLVILAEQGAPGLALFLGYLALSWADLRRRFPADERKDQLQAALAGGFIVACIGALFLAEQYYPPLWFLPALAASMAAALPGTEADDLAEVAPHRLAAGFRGAPAVRRIQLAELVTAPDPAPADDRKLAARGALWLSVGSWGAKATQTVVLLVLARVLAPSEFGILAIAALTYNVLQAVNQLGIGDALVYLQDRIEEASRTALSMVIATGLILMGITWALAPMIASFFHSPAAAFVLRGFAVCLPFDAAAQVPVGRLTRSMSFSRRAVTDTLPSVIGAGVTIGVVVSGYPLIGLVAGQIAGSVANVAIAMLVGPRCMPGWSTAMARRLLRYGGYLSAADLINFGLLNADYIVVGHVLGPVALGLYSLAYRICFMPYLSIAVVANGAVFPYYCRLPSREAIARASEQAICLITAISIPWFAGLVLFAGDVALLGAKWAPAAGAVRFLAVYGLFLSLILSALQVLKAVGRSDLVFLGRGLHLAILTAVLIGTVRGGITVVALDQALVACAIALLTCLWTVRYASVRPASLARSVGLPLLGVAGMVLVVLLLSRLPRLGAIPSWTSLLVLGPLALAVFAGISLAVMPGPLRQGWAALRGTTHVT